MLSLQIEQEHAKAVGHSRVRNFVYPISLPRIIHKQFIFLVTRYSVASYGT